MNEQLPIAQWRVADLIAGIGSDKASPGAGAAGAVALALASACAAKAAIISLKHHAGDAALAAAAVEFQRIGGAALESADRDAQLFARMLHDKTSSAAEDLLRADEEILRGVSALLACVAEIEARCHPSMSGDLVAARQLAHSARKIDARNIAETSGENQ
jgi:hypothetical protein